MKAISIRQPWAWLIVNGFKDIENRSWRTKYRGPVLIHASAAKPSMDDYGAVIDILLKNRLYDVDFPSFNNFIMPENWPGHRGIERGGIVGWRLSPIALMKAHRRGSSGRKASL